MRVKGRTFCYTPLAAALVVVMGARRLLSEACVSSVNSGMNDAFFHRMPLTWRFGRWPSAMAWSRQFKHG